MNAYPPVPSLTPGSELRRYRSNSTLSWLRKGNEICLRFRWCAIRRTKVVFIVSSAWHISILCICFYCLDNHLSVFCLSAITWMGRRNLQTGAARLPVDLVDMEHKSKIDYCHNQPLVRTYCNLGNFEGAIEKFWSLLRVNPNDDQVCVYSYSRLFLWI